MRWLVFATSMLMCAALCRAGEGDPPSPFGPPRKVRDDARRAEAHLSDGTVLKGHLTVARGSPFKIFDRARKTHREAPLEAIAKIVVEPEKERMEKEWRFLEHANDEKVYTGRQYPMRQYVTTIEIVTGVTIVGDCSKPMTLTTDDGKKHKLILQKRDKGEPGTTLEELIYIEKIVFEKTDR